MTNRNPEYLKAQEQKLITESVIDCYKSITQAKKELQSVQKDYYKNLCNDYEIDKQRLNTIHRLQSEINDYQEQLDYLEQQQNKFDKDPMLFINVEQYHEDVVAKPVNEWL